MAELEPEEVDEEPEDDDEPPSRWPKAEVVPFTQVAPGVLVAYCRVKDSVSLTKTESSGRTAVYAPEYRLR